GAEQGLRSRWRPSIRARQSAPVAASHATRQARPVAETSVPYFSMSRVVMTLVANAIALGGVLTGRLMASDAENATTIAPERGETIASDVAMGIIKFAAAELLMKFETATVNTANTTSSASGDSGKSATMPDSA